MKTAPVKYRYAFNVVTYGYTTAFWNEPRWLREVDWMALHGVNMPLASAGQEYIWDEVFAQLQLDEAELTTYDTGPAYLPWQRMGNVSKRCRNALVLTDAKLPSDTRLGWTIAQIMENGAICTAKASRAPNGLAGHAARVAMLCGARSEGICEAVPKRFVPQPPLLRKSQYDMVM